MHILHSLQEISSSKNLRKPVVLTIGNFDGVHLGHLALLKQVSEEAKNENKSSVVISFATHPSEVLRPAHPTPLLCTTEHKMKLLELARIDYVVLLPFTKEFSEQSAEEFLLSVQQAVPFQSLILGSDAHIGKNREGSQAVIGKLAKGMGFKVEYFPDYTLEGQRISSSRIRDSIEHGHFIEAEKLLGRPYSICSRVLKGSGRGAPLGFPTANLAVDRLCLPPQGVYAVTLWHKWHQYDGVANLGNAPTLHKGRAPFLEVHLIDKSLDLYDELVDVQFHTFIRPEERFENVEALKAQIAQDIATAKKLLK